MGVSTGTVVLHYRCLEDTRRCLRSLERISSPEHEILLVDGASGDGSLEILAREFPRIPRLALRRNQGYTGGNNRGIERFLAQGVDYVQILNPDVEVVQPDYLETLTGLMEADATLGAVGPRVFYRNADTVQRTWLRIPRTWDIFRGRGPGTVARERAPREVRKVEVLHGVCMLLRADALRRVGGFDESYFMYGEEMDLCYRLRQAGYELLHVPVDAIVHHHSGTPVPFDLAHNLSRSSHVRFLARHRSRIAALPALTWFLLAGTVKKLLRPRSRGFPRYLKALISAFSGSPVGPPEEGEAASGTTCPSLPEEAQATSRASSAGSLDRPREDGIDSGQSSRP